MQWKLAWPLLWIGMGLWAQGWEPLRDSLLIENERIESLELEQRPLPTLPVLTSPGWRADRLDWEMAPRPITTPPSVLQPIRPSWTKRSPLHVRYGIGRFWTQSVQGSWGRTRDLRSDEGISFSHISTPVGHVEKARWGYSYLQGWIGRYTSQSLWEATYRAGYEKFVYYAPYAERWSGFTENPPLEDSLRGHYGRQELRFRAEHLRWGALQFSTRRLDFRRGTPEWQATLQLSSPRYKLPVIGTGQTQFFGFLEGQRHFLLVESIAERSRPSAFLRAGIRAGVAKDSSRHFFITPIVYGVYLRFPEWFQPYIQAQGDIRPLTYFSASELNPFLRRERSILPLTREWIRSEAGIRGKGQGWDYRIAGEYRYAQNVLLFKPEGTFFILRSISSFQSMGALLEAVYAPLANGPYGELRASYRYWFLPSSTRYYSMSPWEVVARGGYQWEDKAAFSLSCQAIGPRYLTDTVQAAPFVDVSWEAHVRLWPFLSFFAQMNNILNQRFYRWYGYRERPWDIQVGIWLKLG
ncbi:MAG: hypothetical protein N2170_02340 [Bacteroidia bacterium]|nr:hypothetical protein [Bacteroidia bacterium]